MEKSLHLFDLDYTLWKIDAKLAVIDKNDPKNIIFRIPAEEVNFMKDFYKPFNLKVSYNGYDWYLNEKTWNKIKNLKKGLELKDIGISFREYNDSEILENQIQKTDYLLENLNHLKNNHIEIGFVTARSSKKNHKKNLETLIEKIERKLHTNVNKIYFVNDIDNNNNSDTTSYRKAKIVLEYLTGFKIKGNKFIDLKQTKFNNISFYDDEVKNIDAVQNIQRNLERFLIRTDLEVKKTIIESLKTNKICYKTYLITQNKIEPFIIKEFILLPPNHIKLFENFKLKK
jgi:hypothetical protein